MDDRIIPISAGYKQDTQRIIRLFAGQLDDQYVRLRKAIEGLTVQQLEWQPHPGLNTIGMLLAHLAVVDVWWIVIAPQGQGSFDSAESIFKEIIGIGGDDDGMPIKPDGRHAEALGGRSAADYFAMLDKARAAVHQALQGWSDSGLDELYTLRDRRISRSWTVYHVLEHYAAHFGQILLLKHLMRDAGVLVEEKK